MQHCGRALASWLLCGLAATGCVSAQTGQQLTRVQRASAPHVTRASASSEREPTLELPLRRAAVVKRVLEHSPTLSMLARRARALVQAGHAEAALPSPELEFQAWNLPLARPYAAGDADMYMLELRQRFPAGGVQDARARAMAEEAEGVLAELAEEEAALAARAENALTDYALANAAQRVQQQQLAQLERVRQAVQARIATGGARLAEISRLDTEVAKAERARIRSEGQLAEASAQLNALLGRPVGSELRTPAPLAVHTVRLPTTDLLKIADEKRGLARGARAKLRAAEARGDAARATARRPEVMLGVGYWQEPRMRAGFGLSASTSLPWLWGPGRALERQAEEEAAAERDALRAASLVARIEITELSARLQTLEREWQVVQRDALPAARRTVDAVTAAYASGNGSLVEWVDSARSALDLELEVLDLEAQLARGVTGLERAVGSALRRTPLDSGVEP